MMNQKQIVEMLEKFAEEITKAERKRCVEIIEKESQDWDSNYKEVALELAGAIEEEK